MSFDPRDPADPYDNPGFSGGAPQRPQAPGPRDPYDYRDPFDPTVGATDSQKQAARSRVMGPAIIFIITGVVNLLWGGYFVVDSLYINSIPPEQFEAQQAQIAPQNAKNLKQQGITMKDLQLWSFLFYLILGFYTLLTALILMAGGGSMLATKMWGLGVTASILALLSPGGCCCIIGLVGGIWGLIALLNGEVRAAFR
jgi:hypothetical protein